MSIGTMARGILAKGRNSAGDPLTGEITAHVAALRRYALVLVGDPHEADDLVLLDLQGHVVERPDGAEVARDVP